MQISYYFALTKIQKLQNLKLKKKLFSILVGMLGIGRYCSKLANIFSGMKHGGYMYWFACRYGIYQQLRYVIDSLSCIWKFVGSRYRVVVRKLSGENIIMAALSEKIPMPSSIVLLETLAARRAILFIYELCFCGSIFEGDLAISINAHKKLLQFSVWTYH